MMSTLQGENKQDVDTMEETLKAFNDVKNRLSTEHRVVFTEAGLAFEGGMQNIEHPASQEFFKEYLKEIVGIFLRQHPSSFAAHAMVEFDRVLNGAEYAIEWDLTTNHSLHHISALEILFSRHHYYYAEIEAAGGYYDSTRGRTTDRVTRSDLVKNFEVAGCFELLLRMLRKQVPFVEAGVSDESDDEDDDFSDDGMNNNDNMALLSPKSKNPGVPQSPRIQKLSLTTIRQLLVPFVLTKDIVQGFVEDACMAAMEQIRNLNEDDVKGKHAQDIADLHDLFQQVYGIDDPIFIQFSNELALKAFHSKAFPLRKLGLEMIIKTISDLQWEDSPRGALDRNPASFDEESEFTGSDMVKWVEDNNIIESLFEAKKSAHHALINKSKSLLKYLHIRGSLSESNLELIFRSSLGSHESIQGAVHTILAEMVFETTAPVDKCCFILDFAAALEPKHAKEQLSFIRKVMDVRQSTTTQSQQRSGFRGFTKPTSYTSDTAILMPQVESLLNLLWSALFNGPPKAETREHSQQLMRYVIDVIRVPEASMLRERFIRDLLARIQSSKADASNGVKTDPFLVNQAYDLLKRMVHCYSSNISGNGQNSWQMRTGTQSPTSTERSRREMIEYLDAEFNLLDLIVEETKATQQSASSKTSPLVHEFLESVSYRLDFLAYITPRSNVQLKFEHAKGLWDALGNGPAKESFWIWLRRMGTSDFEGESCFAPQALLPIFQELLCTKMEYSSLSIQGFRCLAAFLLEVNKQTGTLEGESEAVTDLSHTINAGGGGSTPKSNSPLDGRPGVVRVLKPAVLGLDTLWQVILTAPSTTAREATELLLQVQMKLEELETSTTHGADNPEGVVEENSHSSTEFLNCRKDFLAKVLAYMQGGLCDKSASASNSNATDVAVVRCVDLLSAYLEHFALPLGVQPHGPVSGKPIELVVHHDSLVLHSVLDIGKQLKKRFKLKTVDVHSRSEYDWYDGIVFDYDPVKDKHGVYYADSTSKYYDMHTMSRVGGLNPPTEEWQYRMIPWYKYRDAVKKLKALRITPENLQQKFDEARRLCGIVSLPPNSPAKYVAASKQYEPIRLHVRLGTTLNQIRMLIYEHIIRSSNGRVPVVPENMVLRVAVEHRPKPPEENAAAGSATRQLLNGNQRRTSQTDHLQGNNPVTTYFKSIMGSGKMPLGSVLNPGENVVHLEYNSNQPLTCQPPQQLGEGAEALPAVAITDAESEFSPVFMQLLDAPLVPYVTRQRLWMLLMALPTDRRQLNRLKEGSNLDWSDELESPNASILHVIYVLQIVDQLLEQRNNKEVAQWSSNFLASGGFSQVCKLLNKVLSTTSDATEVIASATSNGEYSSTEQQELASFLVWQRSVALPVIIRIIKHCVECSSSKSDDDSNFAPKHLLEYLVVNLGKLLTSVQNDKQLQSNGILSVLDGQGDVDEDMESPVEFDASMLSPRSGDVRTTGNDLEQQDGQTEVCCTALEVLKMVLANHPEFASKFITEMTQATTVFDVLLLNPSSVFRNELSKLLLQVLRSSSKESSEGESGTMVTVTKLAIGTLDRIPVGNDSCGVFFAFLRELVKHQLEVQGPDGALSTAASVLARRIIAYSLIVKDDSGTEVDLPGEASGSGSSRRGSRQSQLTASDQAQSRGLASTYPSFSSTTAIVSSVDPTLLGYLQLMLDVVGMLGSTVCCDRNLCEPLMECLLNRYLVALPTPRDPKHSAIARHAKTRKACFDLLQALAFASEHNMHWLSRNLTEFFDETSVPTSRAGRAEWSYQSDHMRRSRREFVGLVNQGATCYQNSVLQQLFMAPQVREMIVNSVPTWTSSLVKEEDTRQMNSNRSPNTGGPRRKLKPKTKSNLIKTLQRAFTFLSLSDHPYFNPRPFVIQTSVLKLSDGHLNQNDAIEFYSRLVECFEESLAGQAEEQRLKDLLYVRTCTMNVRSCKGKHRTQSEMATPFLTLNIQSGATGPTLHSLQEALESQFSTEKLSGLQCDICSAEESDDARYDAEQIKYFEKLPPVLVMQLQRFDFDYEMLIPTKLNHRVSFERRIDLTKFTRDYVMRKFDEAEAAEEDITEAPPAPPSEQPGQQPDAVNPAIYDLKGVVVHHGSGANFGHYYSFIEDRETGNWFRFDDDKVTPFDVSKLEAECFGGPYQQSGDTFANGGSQHVGGSSPQMMPSSQYSRMPMYGGGKGNFKSNNAYLLLYEQVNPGASEANSVPSPVDGEKPISIPKPPPQIPQKSGSCSIAGAVQQLVSLLRWKRRGTARAEAKARAKRYVTEAWEENQRAVRHGIAFAPDFLEFCWGICRGILPRDAKSFSPTVNIPMSLSLADTPQQDNETVSFASDAVGESWSAYSIRRVAMLSVTVLLKVVIRALSQKSVLGHWASCVGQLLALDLAKEPDCNTVSSDDDRAEAFAKVAGRGKSASNCMEWLLLKFVQNEDTKSEWFEGPMIHCPDPHSRNAFMQLMVDVLQTLCTSVAQESKQNLMALEHFADVLIQVTPQGPVNCMQLQPLFRLWKELAKCEALHQKLLSSDVVALLTRLYTENDPATLNMASQDPSEQKLGNNDLHNSRAHLANVNAAANFTCLLHAITIILLPEAATLVSDDVFTDSLFGNQTLGASEQSRNARYSEIADLLRDHRLAPLPQASEAELFNVNTIQQLVARDPGAAGLLVSVIVQGEESFTTAAMRDLEENLREITKTIVEVQFSQRLSDVVECICCISMVVDSMRERRCRELVEGALNLSIMLQQEVAEAERLLSSARGKAAGVNQRRMLDEDRVNKTHVLFGIATMLVNLFYCNTEVRAILRESVARWSWMPQVLDDVSYSRFMGGIVEVGTRNVALGSIARSMAKILFCVTGDLPELRPVHVTCCQVEGCGLEVLNGIYRFDGFFVEGASSQVDSTTPKFVRVVNGVRYVMYRCKVVNLKYNWYISNVSSSPGTSKDVDFCCSVQGDGDSLPTLLPPRGSWQMCGNNPGPPPKLKLITRELDPTEDLFEWTEDISRYSGVDTSALVPPLDGSSVSTNSDSNSFSSGTDEIL